MSRPTIVFIESNTTGTGGILLELALQRDYKVHFLSARPSRYPFLNQQWVSAEVTDTSDYANLESRLEVLKPTAILTTSEYYLETVARLAARFDLPGSDPQAVALCRHKGELAPTLKKAGVCSPQTVVVKNMDQLDLAEQNLAYPMVVKPARGSGSIGVRLCYDRDDLHAHVTKLLAVQGNERGLVVEPVVVIQNRIQGHEFSVEILGTENGFRVFGITRKHLGSLPHFLETGHDFPAVLQPDEEMALMETAFASLRATGLTRGPAHVELRYHQGQAHLIEINPRLAGGMIPVLIERALGLDPLACLLDFAQTGQACLDAPHKNGASIRFLVPHRSGVLKKGPDVVRLAGQPGILQARFNKTNGEEVALNGDFRDRLGWILSKGTHATESARLAETALAQVLMEIEEVPQPQARFNQQARSGLHPDAMTIVRKTPPGAVRLDELNHLATMDRAHLVMLLRCELLPSETVCTLLRAINQLADNQFGDLLEQPAPRGTYLLYEDALIGRCGLQQGGATHLGRSRNDMNATQFKLALREPFRQVNAALWQLRQGLLERAATYAHVAMPVYSQYQPGLPGTYGYYLLGVEESLSRDQQGLLNCIEGLNQSPLGACAGAGTTLPIAPEMTAGLLGFHQPSPHALDAVAGRDLGLRLISALAIAGVTLSRCLQDLQLWTTREFNFLNVPDHLSGGSSMMPQKRNPYLLEMAQGRAAIPGASQNEILQGMLKTPFSNSVQVGTEAVKPIDRSIQALREAAVLTRLFITHFTPNQEAMKASMTGGNVMITAVAETMAASGEMSFRDAHHRLARTLAEAVGRPTDEILAEVFPQYAHVYSNTPEDWPNHFAFGGGPGQWRKQLNLAQQRLGEDGALLRTTVQGWQRARTHLDQTVENLLQRQQESEAYVNFGA